MFLWRIILVFRIKYKFLEGGAEMQITDVDVKKLNTEGRRKAVASITFDNEFVVHSIKVEYSEKREGLCISMPSRKLANGKFKDVAHPINQETRDKIESAVLEKYNSLADEEPNSEETEEA